VHYRSRLVCGCTIFFAIWDGSVDVTFGACCGYWDWDGSIYGRSSWNILLGLGRGIDKGLHLAISIVWFHALLRLSGFCLKGEEREVR
jgi:hypothetical protein